ncbi:MAG: CRISPR-associated endoribonuclease Cas6 [Saprospiraceae bacterium]|nr:CRISPR-associated endoribonuclease Cas6 [Saprospiraceae bacterium]
MRLKLILQTLPNSVLSYNHQYSLMAVIYKIIERADPVFSHWLHERGYDGHGNKKFKLFSFGLLTGKPYSRDDPNKRLIFPTGQVEWEVSFCVDKQIEKFVEGLFKNQLLEIVADGTKVLFQVQGVEIVKPPIFSETMRFSVKTGICLTEKTETDRYPQFRSPDDAAFKDLFFNNLAAKVQSAFPDEAVATPPYLDLKILSEPRKWSVIVPQEDSNKPIRTIGYKFDFEVTAPAQWLEVGYFSGFGKNSSMGFGFSEVLK